MLKKVLFLLAMGMLLLTMWIGCVQVADNSTADNSTNEGVYPASFKGASFGEPAKVRPDSPSQSTR